PPPLPGHEWPARSAAGTSTREPAAPDAPDLVPDEIAHDGARERKRRREPEAEAAVPGQGAGTQEKGLARHRGHELFEDHPAEEGRIAIRANEEVEAVHLKLSETLLLPRRENRRPIHSRASRWSRFALRRRR